VIHGYYELILIYGWQDFLRPLAGELVSTAARMDAVLFVVKEQEFL
jgi:hypothetical protein